MTKDEIAMLAAARDATTDEDAKRALRFALKRITKLENTIHETRTLLKMLQDHINTKMKEE